MFVVLEQKGWTSAKKKGEFLSFGSEIKKYRSLRLPFWSKSLRSELKFLNPLGFRSELKILDFSGFRLEITILDLQRFRYEIRFLELSQEEIVKLAECPTMEKWHRK